MKTTIIDLVLKADKSGELKLEKKTKGAFVVYEKCSLAGKRRK